MEYKWNEIRINQQNVKKLKYVYCLHIKALRVEFKADIIF